MAFDRMNIVQSQFRFSVPINNLEKFETPDITVGGAPWKLRVEKVSVNDENGNHDVIDIILICNSASQIVSSEWSIEAGATLRLISFNDPKISIQKELTNRKFRNGFVEAKLHNFISWSNLTDATNGYIRNDEFTFDAMITSSPLRSNQIKVPGFELTCTQFDISIFDLFFYQTDYNYTSYRSPVVFLRGIKWYVEMLRTNQGLNIHLHNETDPNNFGWSFDVYFKVKLLSFDDTTEPLERIIKQRSTTDGNRIGWTPFATKADLTDLKKSFVHLNKATMEISIDIGPWQPSCRNQKDLLEDGMRLATKCSICLGKFIGQKVLATACGHLFCNDCICNAINVNDRCPLCQQEPIKAGLRVVYLHS